VKNIKHENLQGELIMRLVNYFMFIGISLLFFSLTALADTLVLKDGQVLQGMFTGGTAEAIQFDVNGKIQSVALSEITTLTLSPREAKAAAVAPAAAAAAPAMAVTAAAPAAGTSSPGTIPAGTKMMLNIKETISTASHKQGAKISAVLENDLAVGGTVFATKGTTVYGTVLESVGGRAIGTSKLLVTFTDLNINSQMIPIVTDDLGAESQPGRAAKTVGAAALIGGAAGSAGKGAAVGGAVALMAAKGNHIQVPAGSLVEVSLKQPVTVP
jgi:hypothetical protein